MNDNSDDYEVVTHHSRQKINGEWREGLIVERKVNAVSDDAIAKAMDNFAAPLRTKIERSLRRYESEAKSVAQVYGLDSTLDRPTKLTGNPTEKLKQQEPHAGMVADPCTPLSFAYKMEYGAYTCRRLLKRLDEKGLPDDVMWEIESLVLEACVMADGQRMLHISEIEREAMSGAKLLEQRNGTPPEIQRQAVKDYHKLKADNPSKRETWLKNTIGDKYHVHRSRIHEWIKTHV